MSSIQYLLRVDGFGLGSIRRWMLVRRGRRRPRDRFLDFGARTDIDVLPHVVLDTYFREIISIRCRCSSTADLLQLVSAAMTYAHPSPLRRCDRLYIVILFFLLHSLSILQSTIDLIPEIPRESATSRRSSSTPPAMSFDRVRSGGSRFVQVETHTINRLLELKVFLFLRFQDRLCFASDPEITFESFDLGLERLYLAIELL